MARRFGLRDTQVDAETSSQGSSSVLGMIKFHPSRRTGQESWRSRQSSELRGSDHNENVTMVAEHMKGLLPLTRSTTTSALSPAVYDEVSSIPEHAPTLNDRKDSGQGTFAMMGAEKRSDPMETHHDINDRYVDLFGKLPDPIRLHEQTGEFDGQVVFIGHPNRDVSAHSWSTASFQWENIGRYSHAHDKIEGSLASDLVQENDTPRNALVSFKLAAENREKLIVDGGRSMEVDDISSPPSRDSLETKITDANPEGVGEHAHHSRTEGVVLSSHNSPYRTIKKEHLEDPFVAKADCPQTEFDHRDQSEPKTVEMKGSLDFKYEFPGRPDTPSRPSNSDPTVTSVQGRMPTSTPLVRSTVYERPAQATQLSLREIDVGEEAAGGVMFSFGQGVRPRKVPAASPETVGASFRPEENVYAGAEKWNYTAIPFQGRLSAPRFDGLQPTPTTNDPTASLSVHIGEEEKLRAWFCDGHRPSRQREYALSLMSAAASSSRNRYLGAIGEAKDISLNGETKNTLPFVRLYEGLSEYIEESHHGSGGSYFTKSWKTAPAYLRDLGPDGNNSFFSTGGTNSAQYQYPTSNRSLEDRQQRFSEPKFVGGATSFFPIHGPVGDAGSRLGKLRAHMTT
ncbi:hypothetical protein BDU57DRAFT_502125 [Ampelomyces quisqualis]|uniref:Uncharacterized protein n=1 Tax=Ampelomyces quisqualis TaxID=50730 RepID=A0A6A5QGC2_AMPQU|nr:hypothetical protein BDU57DRAFT_502125 [Ampelomyces quisqualis]